MTNNSLANPYPKGASCKPIANETVNQWPTWITEGGHLNSLDSVPLSCINQSMDAFYLWAQSSRRKIFGQCSGSNETAIPSAEPFCKTDAYLGSINNSFTNVMTCLGLNPRDVFAITAAESGFHVNAMSAIGQDYGISQISEIGAVEVNLQWDRLKQEVLNSDSDSCKKIAPFVESFKKTSSNWGNSCQLISFPENPTKNFIYKGFLFAIHKQYLNNHFKKTRVLQKIVRLLGRDMNPSEQNDFMTVLTLMAYNAGIQTVFDAVDAFFNEKLNLLNPSATDLEAQKVDLYLAASNARFSRDSQLEKILLQKHSNVVSRIQKMNSGLVNYFDVSIFSGRGEVGDFGEFILRTERSKYLRHILNFSSQMGLRAGGNENFCVSNQFLRVGASTDLSHK